MLHRTAALFLMLASAPALAAGVKVTPLGSQQGEFCPKDRAMVFEDPKGTRILYDPGMTVAGASDPRLGKIDVVLISHMHGDHVGSAHIKAPNAGCADTPQMVSDVPETNAVAIALAKGAKIVTGPEMPAFLAAKLKAAGGDPRDSVLARFGASVTVGGVKIATVPALHSNGVAPDLIGGELGAQMKAAGIADLKTLTLRAAFDDFAGKFQQNGETFKNVCVEQARQLGFKPAGFQETIDRALAHASGAHAAALTSDLSDV